MNANPTQNDILGLEKKYWDAMKNNDVEAAVKMTKFPCVITSTKGAQRVEEKDYRKMMESANGDNYKGIELENPQVNFLGKDTALISYSIKYQGKNMLYV